MRSPKQAGTFRIVLLSGDDTPTDLLARSKHLGCGLQHSWSAVRQVAVRKQNAMNYMIPQWNSR